MFYVKLKESAVESLSFLRDKGFDSKTVYPVVCSLQDKLLVADPKSGKMAEVYPRNCIYREIS